MNQVTICNMALARLGQSTIQSITETNSVGAEFCNLFYKPVRQWLLRHHPWGFAKTSVALAQTTTTPLGWDFQYQLPEGCLRVWSVVDEAGSGTELVASFANGELNYKPMASSSTPIEFDIFGDKLHTNLGAAYAVYNQDITDPELFDPMFSDAFAWRLAYEVAMPLSGKMALRKQALEGFEMSMASATTASSNERRVRQVVGSDLVEARR